MGSFLYPVELQGLVNSTIGSKFRNYKQCRASIRHTWFLGSCPNLTLLSWFDFQCWACVARASPLCWGYRRWCLRAIPCMFIFSISFQIPLIVLRAGCLVVCMSYHQYPTEMAQRICLFTICQWGHVSIYTIYLTQIPYSSPDSSQSITHTSMLNMSIHKWSTFHPFVQCIEDMVWESTPSHTISHWNSEQLGWHHTWETLSLSLRWARYAATPKRVCVIESLWWCGMSFGKRVQCWRWWLGFEWDSERYEEVKKNATSCRDTGMSMVTGVCFPSIMALLIMLTTASVVLKGMTGQMLAASCPISNVLQSKWVGSLAMFMLVLSVQSLQDMVKKSSSL